MRFYMIPTGRTILSRVYASWRLMLRLRTPSDALVLGFVHHPGGFPRITDRAARYVASAVIAIRDGAVGRVCVDSAPPIRHHV